MEAPEKVYLLFNRPYLVDYTKLKKRRCDEEVEYTRTDVFIEQTCRWLFEHGMTQHVIERYRKDMEE